MQYRPKIQEYRPSCGKKGRGPRVLYFLDTIFPVLVFLNTSLLCYMYHVTPSIHPSVIVKITLHREAGRDPVDLR